MGGHHRKTTFLLAAAPLLAFTQPDTTHLPPVEVTATPIASPLAGTGRHLQVIDSLALHGAARPEVSEVLRNNSLVDVRQRGPFDVQTDLSIRGGTFDQALVLVDGIPMTDPQTGHHLMELPLTTDALERVEVLYGGASRTFGAGAFSGAINLITGRPEDTRGQLTVEGAGYGTVRARAMQDVMLGTTGLRIAGMTAHSDGYVHDSDFDQDGGQFEVVHSFGRSALRMEGGAVRKRFGAQNFYTSAYPDQQEITGTYFMSAAVHHAGARWTWDLTGYGRRHDDRFELFREGDGYYRYSDGYFIRGEADTARFSPTFFYTYHNRHRTDVVGGEAQAKGAWKAGITSFSAQARYEHIYSNVLGQLLDTPVHAAGTREDLTRADERRNLALTVDHRYSHGRWTIDAGVLLNINSAFTPEWAPGLDVVHRWSDKQSSYANVARSFRFPTWTDLYYNRGGAVGSIDLRPEHATQFELGHRITAGHVSLKACVWHRQGSDLIDWVELPGETTTHAANLTEVDLNGAELEASWSRGKGSGGLLYGYQWADQTAFSFHSLYVLDQLTHNAVLWWRQPFAKRFRAQASLTWRQRYGTYARFSDGALVDYPDPLRVDLRVDWTHGRIMLFASGYNLLDAEQMDRANVPLPGRWLGGGVQVRWGEGTVRGRTQPT